MFDNYKNKFIPFIVPIILILFWYFITDGIELFSSYILPSPVDVVNSAWVVIQNGKLLTNTVDTLFKVFAGLICASVVAVPVGQWERDVLGRVKLLFRGVFDKRRHSIRGGIDL